MPNMTYLNWCPENDKTVTSHEIDLHNQLHAKLAQEQDIRSIFKNKRLKLIPHIEKKLDIRFHGQVLDIGCGSGYASTWLALNREVEKVYALETSRSAVSELIPKVSAHYGVENKVIPVHGSFNSIPEKNKFDFILAFGALHHSGDLLKTVKECYNALRPGGYLVLQEPALSDYVTNQAYIDTYESEENFRGLTTIRKKDRHDHFFRECEYKTAFHFAGFEIHFYRPKVLTEKSIVPVLKWIYKSFIRLSYQLITGKVKQWPYNDSTSLYSYVAALHKPKVEPSYIPHIWERIDCSK